MAFVVVNVDLDGAITDPTLADRFHARFLDNFAEVLERAAIPRMRQRVPVRTGRLKRSIRLSYERNRGVVVIRSAFYAGYVPRARHELRRVFVDTIRANLQPVLDKTTREVLP